MCSILVHNASTNIVKRVRPHVIASNDPEVGRATLESSKKLRIRLVGDVDDGAFGKDELTLQNQVGSPSVDETET